MFVKINNIKNGLPWTFTEPKNSYRWVPKISGHRTEDLFSTGFEILGLAFLLVLKKQKLTEIPIFYI